ncbi:unnamed protein product [Pleuronectes platessa]|uniref:Uncharacterized protein n=1 Tax=Pleuronectes platessa TaxID=8262 RepID=A0A9N7YPN7_PLEPL|nr:unnamed protein product [Pleuronectes platessa]
MALWCTDLPTRHVNRTPLPPPVHYPATTIPHPLLPNKEDKIHREPAIVHPLSSRLHSQTPVCCRAHSCIKSEPPIAANPSTSWEEKENDSSPEHSHLSANCWNCMSTNGSKCLPERTSLSTGLLSSRVLFALKRHIALPNPADRRSITGRVNIREAQAGSKWAVASRDMVNDGPPLSVVIVPQPLGGEVDTS